MATQRQPLNRLTWLMIGLSLRRARVKSEELQVVRLGWGGVGWRCGGAITQGRTRSRPAAALPSHPMPPPGLVSPPFAPWRLW